MMRPLCLDLFSGAAGGWSLGLHRAGYRTIAACEVDPWRRAVFAANNPGVVMFHDVRELTAGRILAACGCLPDVVVGSPPCQDASSANHKGRGVDGARTGLFFEFVRLVGEIRPVWCAAENVPGLRARGYDRVAAGLEALGYAVWPLVVGADDAGANHRRKRVWIVAADTENRRRKPEQPGRDHQQQGTPEGLQRHRLGPSAGHLAGDAAEGVGDTGRVAAEVAAGDAAVASDASRLGCDCGGPPQATGWTGPFAAGDAEGHAADADRIGIREQPGRSGWPRGAGEAWPGGDVGNADKADWAPWQHVASTEGHPRPPRPLPGADAFRTYPPYTDGVRQPAGAEHGQVAGPDRAGHPVGPSLAGHNGEELPPALRDIGRAWPDWNGGLAGLAASCVAAGFSRVDARLPAGLDRVGGALPPSIRNAAIAAYGDAVVPAITEAIGRAMRAVLEAA